VCHASVIAYNSYRQVLTEAPLPAKLSPGHIVTVCIYHIQTGLRNFEVHTAVHLTTAGCYMIRCVSRSSTIFWTLKTEVLRSFETSVTVYQLTWCNVSEELNL
jgi:hypothetical protein